MDRRQPRRVHIEITHYPEMHEWAVGWSSWTQNTTTFRWEVESRGVTPMIGDRHLAIAHAEQLLESALMQLASVDDEHAMGPFD